MDILEKSKNQNFSFLKKKIKYFSRTPVQALGKYFFCFKCKVDVISFHMHFQVSQNIYNWLSKIKSNHDSNGPFKSMMGGKKPPPLITLL